jgi:hypothetical protein
MMSLIGSYLLGQSIRSNSTVSAPHYEVYELHMFACEGEFLAYGVAGQLIEQDFIYNL